MVVTRPKFNPLLSIFCLLVLAFTKSAHTQAASSQKLNSSDLDIIRFVDDNTKNQSSVTRNLSTFNSSANNGNDTIDLMIKTTSGSQDVSLKSTTVDENDYIGNSTLFVDYDRQDYYLSTPAHESSLGANGKETTTSLDELLLDITTSAAVSNESELSSRLIETGEPEADSHSPGNTDAPAYSSDAAQRSSVEFSNYKRTSKLSLSSRDSRDARLKDKVAINTTNIYKVLLSKKPYSKYWTAEQKWDDIFRRFMAIQGSVKSVLLKKFLRDIEYYADITISQKCADDLRYIQNYASKATNLRWLTHMFDSTGKSEPGMLTGNLANLGHVIQCIKVRAPSRLSNDSIEERFFERQAELLGERFRGKYCLASVRPVLPEKPRLVSRFTEALDTSMISNISYMGESSDILKLRATETSVPDSVYESIDRRRNRLDQVPFESELYEYLIAQRNFMFALPRFMGVCYPSSCTKDDIRYSLQKSLDDQHQVVDIEFDCEQEEQNAWDFFTTPRLMAYVLLFLIVSISFGSSLLRYVLVDKLGWKRQTDEKKASLINTLDILSMDKCAGILFVKTKPASPMVDLSKFENNRSTSIDALRGFLILVLVYSQLVVLGCLPVPFMLAKWADSMFPFYRSLITQIFLNSSIWSEAFYVISAYLISAKFFENNRTYSNPKRPANTPNLASYIMKRYIKLTLPMIAFILINYVWPRLSNGYVMQDQANKLMKPCDNHGWTNVLLFHNHHGLNETCLWPTHVSAAFFQLHLLSYPILLLFLASLKLRVDQVGSRKLLQIVSSCSALSLLIIIALFGIIYPAYQASNQELIVPFLIDYIDFDNYERVIEWMVTPTYNHLTSYMVGIALAYLIIKNRVEFETRRASDLEWQGSYMHRESSSESVISSSTQELHTRPVFRITMGGSDVVADRMANSISISSRDSANKAMEYRRGNIERVLSISTTVLSVLLCFISLTASWFWNGLGQPMSSTQTFWYVLGTRLVFNLTFGHLFYKYFATRRNSNNPWMITRFLVPIGRMSLMVFYMSWLVIWFDLLSCLYQWHPSHYFIFEKYNEIIFMTLTLAVFSYGSFEGTIKILQYKRQAEELSKLPIAGGSIASRAQGFESLFQPICNMEDEIENDNRPGKRIETTPGAAASYYKDQDATPKVFDTKSMLTKSSASHSTRANLERAHTLSSDHGTSGFKSCNKPSTDGNVAQQSGRHLSIADQYKLNAELRANYSFASIGLYESAGATDDLQHQSDPQVSSSPER